ncbi:hypothetical protein SDC9_108725 [bioreactor metagenome]|uniref:Uncharacterized protein n=1 Tax=bioreactor metagenome TaxID=1076179 RepID=A0A645B8W8_9ZZZZ
MVGGVVEPGQNFHVVHQVHHIGNHRVRHARIQHGAGLAIVVADHKPILIDSKFRKPGGNHIAAQQIVRNRYPQVAKGVIIAVVQTLIGTQSHQRVISV